MNRLFAVNRTYYGLHGEDSIDIFIGHQTKDNKLEVTDEPILRAFVPHNNQKLPIVQFACSKFTDTDTRVPLISTTEDLSEFLMKNSETGFTISETEDILNIKAETNTTAETWIESVPSEINLDERGSTEKITPVINSSVGYAGDYLIKEMELQFRPEEINQFVFEL